MRPLPLLALALAVVAAGGAARAEEGLSSLPWRFGVLPTAGVGLATVTNPGKFPGFVGLTTLGGEVRFEAPPYGGFARFQFHSSGLDGRWTAPSIAAGGSYRLFGDGVRKLGLLGRGGLMWERWHATDGNCPIDLFVPSNCKALTPAAPTGVITGIPDVVTVTEDLVGLLAGLRAELPVQTFYLALDAEASFLVDVSAPLPGTVAALRIAVSIGFRDARATTESAPAPPDTLYQERHY